MTNFPQRMGEAYCRDFLRTGRCKYGESCKYHHPVGGSKATDPNEPPFPIRPDEPVCQYYIKNATCKFGQTCKFHHPPEILLSKGNGNQHGNINNSGVSSSCLIVPRNTNHNGSIMTRMNHQTRILDAANNRAEESNISSRTSSLSTPSASRNGHNQYRDVLPQRPNEPDCIYYLRNGKCKYGATCKYHHPPNGHDNNLNKEAIPLNRRPHSSSSNNLLGPGHMSSPRTYTRQRSSSDSIQEMHPPIRRNSSSLSSNTASPFIHESIHRQLQGQSVLGTIDNSFQQYPHHMQAALDLNSITRLGGNYRNLTNNGPNTTPKVGSPSMSSSTVASSYDTASLETITPARNQGQAQNQAINVSSPSQEMNSMKNPYSKVPELNLPQVNSVGQLLYQMNPLTPTQNNQEVTLQYSTQPVPVPASGNGMSRDLHSRPYNELQQQNLHNFQHQQMINHQQFQVNRQPMKSNSFSSNTSIASLSPTSELTDYLSNDVVNKKNARSVDDGLSMMTDALLTMLDTQDEGAGAATPRHQPFFLDKRQPHANTTPASSSSHMMMNTNRLSNSLPNRNNSLPDFPSYDNSARANNQAQQSLNLSAHHYPNTNLNLRLQESSGRKRMGNNNQFHHEAAQPGTTAYPPNLFNTRAQIAMAPVDNSSGRPPTQFYMPS